MGSLPDIINLSDKCYGCGACAAICGKNCITMAEDNAGFLRPHIDGQKCIMCHACDRICPAFSRLEEDQCIGVYGAKASSDELLRDSSSGGIFSLLAEQALAHGGVVVGAAFDDAMVVRHIAICSHEKLGRIRSSKYVQSSVDCDIYSCVKSALVEGKSVLFSGTACQIAALRSYLGNLSGANSLLLVEVVCHGVPSPKLWRKWKDWLENQVGSPLVNAMFRDKTTGWSSYSVVYRFANGRIIKRLASDDWYMKAFLHDDALRPSCYSCRAKRHCGADLTLGDFWGVWKAYPHMKWGDGVSAVMIKSERGAKAIRSLQHNVNSFAVDFNDVVKWNPAVVTSVPRGQNCDEFHAMLADDVILEEMKYRFPYKRPLPHRILSAAGVLRSKLNTLIKSD